MKLSAMELSWPMSLLGLAAVCRWHKSKEIKEAAWAERGKGSGVHVCQFVLNRKKCFSKFLGVLHTQGEVFAGKGGKGRNMIPRISSLRKGWRRCLYLFRTAASWWGESHAALWRAAQFWKYSKRDHKLIRGCNHNKKLFGIAFWNILSIRKPWGVDRVRCTWADASPSVWIPLK